MQGLIWNRRNTVPPTCDVDKECQTSSDTSGIVHESIASDQIDCVSGESLTGEQTCTTQRSSIPRDVVGRGTKNVGNLRPLKDQPCRCLSGTTTDSIRADGALMLPCFNSKCRLSVDVQWSKAAEQLSESSFRSVTTSNEAVTCLRRRRPTQLVDDAVTAAKTSAEW